MKENWMYFLESIELIVEIGSYLIHILFISNFISYLIHRGSSLLNEKFLVMWAQDDYRDYLAEIEYDWI